VGLLVIVGAFLAALAALAGCNCVGGAVAGGWQDVKQGIHRMDTAMQRDQAVAEK
jgi:hypothetical protein